MELVLVDPGTVVGPNYSSKPTCIECLHPGMKELEIILLYPNNLYAHNAHEISIQYHMLLICSRSR